MDRLITAEQLSSELDFTATRSSKPGGQNVNKVSSKVVLRFDISGSTLIDDKTKALLLEKWSSKVTTEGVLILESQIHRSQLQNKKAVVMRFDSMLGEALQKKKIRKRTKPSKGAVKARLKSKKKLSEKKDWRKKPDTP